MGDESNRLAAPPNVGTPPNPGKPAPWNPPDEDASTPQPADDGGHRAAARRRAGAVASTVLDRTLQDVLDNPNHRLDGLVGRRADVELALES